MTTGPLSASVTVRRHFSRFRDRYYHQRFRIAGNAVGKDGHQSWARRKIIHRRGSKGGIGPPCYWIDRQEGNLAVFDAAQLDHWVVGGRILEVSAGSLRDSLEKRAGQHKGAA